MARLNNERPTSNAGCCLAGSFASYTRLQRFASLSRMENTPQEPRSADDSVYGDCCLCDGYILAIAECPFCPTCARIPLEQRKAIFAAWAHNLSLKGESQ